MMNEDSFTLPFHEIGLWSSELGLPQEPLSTNPNLRLEPQVRADWSTLKKG